MTPAAAGSVETRWSWIVAVVSLGIMATSFAAPLLSVVGLKLIAAEFGSARSVPALAYSLAWFGTAIGGLMMGRIAERFGVRWTVGGGAVMIAAGLLVSSLDGAATLQLGHGLLIGLIGNSGINAPLYVYVTRWFDRRRGTALALIASGQYMAGFIWPSIFEQMIGAVGWREAMQIFPAIELALILPMALFFLRPPPEPPQGLSGQSDVVGTGPAGMPRPLGLPPNLLFALIAFASFLCCIGMSMPAGHLVAFCSDLGMAPGRGAAMLSLLLGTAFVSRQAWGWVSDRIGGLRTVLAGSICQAAGLSGFLFTQDEIGLITVATGFRLGFSGIIPAYALAVRELFPAREASWRMPALLLCTGCGMATGGWLAGALYDLFGFYAPAFGAGVAFNLANLVIIAPLVWRLNRWQAAGAIATPPAGRPA